MTAIARLFRHRHLAARAAVLLLGAGCALTQPVQAADPSYADRVTQVAAYRSAQLQDAPDVETRIYTLLNALRRDQSIPTLARRQALTEAARTKARWIQRDNYFSHTDPAGGGPSDRVAALDRDGIYRSVGENLASFGPVIAGIGDDIHKGWVNSPGHYENMINPVFDEVGVGCVENLRQIVCGQVFAKRAGSLRRPLPVHLRQRDTVQVSALLDGLDFGGWILKNEAGEEIERGRTETMILPDSLSGEMRLNILGAKRESMTRILLYHLAGPSIVVE